MAHVPHLELIGNYFPRQASAREGHKSHVTRFVLWFATILEVWYFWGLLGVGAKFGWVKMVLVGSNLLPVFLSSTITVRLSTSPSSSLARFIYNLYHFVLAPHI